jgi:lantibiotic modifying enzyme
MSGIAWSLLEMGARQEAEEIFNRTFRHRLLHQSPDIFYGTAGWGMANLRFFIATANEMYLEKAEQAGNRLLNTCNDSERGCSWGTPSESNIGFAHGASGIALFLLYLYLATGNERYLITGQRGLEFDLSFATETKDSGLSWPQSVQTSSPVYPYWRFGSAGIGMATLRFYKLLGVERYRSILERIFVDIDRKYAVFPGRFTGLAGLGDFALDLHEFTGESRFFGAACNVASGIMRFRVDRRGIAFPGDSLSRLSCDYGTGSAGIALFLSRLAGRKKGDFMLDSLFGKPECDLNHQGTLKPAPSFCQEHFS